VKLFLRYEKQKSEDPWAMATGWLIRDDLLVTAGHCAFDWSHNLGRLTHIKAYLGYSGKGSISDSNVQFRKGKRVVTTSEWLTTRGNKSHDVSFIQLQHPFTKVQPIRFVDTPKSGTLVLGVVGYPGDKTDGNTGEAGARMYQMFRETPYNLEESRDRMLEYTIDTYGGKYSGI
jgi:V8-like Glu-specific endopeptidase